MDEPLEAAPTKTCCVCGAQNGKHCAKCKSRHYCSKACQLVDWKRGHNKACKQMAAEFQDRLLDTLMPAKLKVKEEPAIVADFVSADDSKAAARLPAVGSTVLVKASAPNGDTPDWLVTCAICLGVLPLEGNQQTFYDCCCKKICTECNVKCWQHDERCPLYRAPAYKSDAEFLSRLQKHVDKGNADAQYMLGQVHNGGQMGLRKNLKRAFQFYALAAAQGHAPAQCAIGISYHLGEGCDVDLEAPAMWLQRAAEQGLPGAQFNLGLALYAGDGVAQSYAEAVKWWRLAAAQGHAALANLGTCHTCGQGVPQDLGEALRLYKRAAAKGHAQAAERVVLLSEAAACVADV